MAAALGKRFLTIVRSLDALREIVDADHYAAFRLPAAAKRVVTFLREPSRGKLALPVEVDGARILCLRGSEVFTAYVPGSRGPVFMTLIENTLGEALTTRTWDTVKKVVGVPPAAAAGTRRSRRRD